MKDIHITISSRTIYQTYAALLALGILLVVNFAHATTPDPGHPWTAVGNGFWQASNSQTALRTFTFPDSDETVLTTAGAPQSGTVPYGNGTGVLATTTAGTNGFVLALSSGIPTWIATTTLANISGTLGLTGGGTNASLTANNGGIVWSNATQLQILAGTATANKVLMSGSTATPSWSTPTYPNAANPTTREIIVSDGTNWTASTETYATPGTAGQVLMSNGTNWISAATSTVGLFNAIQVLTSGTTYTPTSETTKAIVELWGGGGAGGGCSAVAGCAGAGGGAGGYAKYYFTNVGAGPFTIAIGGAGAGASGAVGGNGGNTTFNTGSITITAFGGTGGAFTAGTAAIKFMAGGAGGAISTNGTFNGAGAPGGNGMTSTVNTVVQSGFGGSTSLGGGGVGKTNVTSAGTAAIANTGSGGSGAAAIAATANAGGNGAAGVIVITEFK